MKLEDIPGTYDNEYEEAINILRVSNPDIAEAVEDYVKELLANVHIRDSYIRHLKSDLSQYAFVVRAYVDVNGTPQMTTKDLNVAINETPVPWEMSTDSRINREYINRARHNQ